MELFSTEVYSISDSSVITSPKVEEEEGGPAVGLEHLDEVLDVPLPIVPVGPPRCDVFVPLRTEVPQGGRHVRQVTCPVIGQDAMQVDEAQIGDQDAQISLGLHTQFIRAERRHRLEDAKPVCGCEQRKEAARDVPTSVDDPVSRVSPGVPYLLAKSAEAKGNPPSLRLCRRSFEGSSLRIHPSAFDGGSSAKADKLT